MPQLSAGRERGARFAVLWCEDAPKWEDRRALWGELLGAPGERWVVLDVVRGELPAALDDFDGFLVTGSHYSVLDPVLPTLPSLVEFLRAVRDAEAERRVVGVCFGAQVLAHALGGRVARVPSGDFVLGPETIQLEAGAALLGLPPEGSIRLLEAHGDCVVELPPDGHRLASSPTAPNEVFLVGTRFLGVQGHPELTAAELEERILSTALDAGRLGAEAGRRVRDALREPVHSALMLAALGSFLRSA